MNKRGIKETEAFRRFPEAGRGLLRRLATPRLVQDFIDYRLVYNDDKPDTCFSPLEVLRRGRAHCLEGALLAAAAFLFHGRPPLLLDLRANARDDDHVIAPFREKGGWGAVALSRFCGLRFREPVYRSPAELARSYFDFYYNNRGEKTLRGFSAPLNARKLSPGWLDSGKDVFFVSRQLDAVRHYSMLGGCPEGELRKADSALFRAEVLGSSRRPLVRVRPRPYSALSLPRNLI